MTPENKSQPDKSSVDSIGDLQGEFEAIVQSRPMGEGKDSVAQALIKKGYAIEQVYEFLDINYK